MSSTLRFAVYVRQATSTGASILTLDGQQDMHSKLPRQHLKFVHATKRKTYDDASTTAAFYFRDCDAESAARGRQLEFARRGESFSSLRAGFPVEEPFRICDWQAGHCCLPDAQVDEG